MNSEMSPGVRSGIAMAHHSTPSSQKALMMELKSLQEQPVEGFRIGLVEESDLYNWEVAIFGPPNTLYEGGYFKVRLLCRGVAGLCVVSQLWRKGGGSRVGCTTALLPRGVAGMCVCLQVFLPPISLAQSLPFFPTHPLLSQPPSPLQFDRYAPDSYL